MLTVLRSESHGERLRSEEEDNTPQPVIQVPTSAVSQMPSVFPE